MYDQNSPMNEGTTQPTNTPKSNKLGSVRKCPQCGAMIGSFKMMCPECGFEFSEVGANQFVEKFTQGLQQEIERVRADHSSGLFPGKEGKKLQKKLVDAEVRYVKNHPLPRTKEDCIEMLDFLVPKIGAEASNGAMMSYRQLYFAILGKLENEQEGSSKMQTVVSSYKEKARLSKKQRFVIWWRGLKGFYKFLLCLLVCFLAFCIFVVSMLIVDANMTEEQERLDAIVVQCLNSGDVAGALAAIEEGGDCTPMVDYLIGQGEYDEAEIYVYDAYPDYYDYLSKSVIHMCQNNKQEEAKRFIARKIGYYSGVTMFDEGYKMWNADNVEKNLRAIISNY